MRWLFPVFAIIIASSSTVAFALDDDDDAGPPESYPRVSSLERIILGQTYEADKLPDRLSRLETKAFGEPSKSDDMGDRTDALQTYSEKKLHKEPLGLKRSDDDAIEGTPPPPSSADSSRGSQQSSGGGHSKAQIANLVGNSLLGLASSAMGMPGMLPMMAGMGMGATGMQRRDEPPADDTPVEDPAVMSPNPPPQGARAQVKVGWCEMKLFGRTSPQSHLVERLRAISLKLNLDTKQNNLDLLDDIDTFVKAVQNKNMSVPQTADTALPQ